jgi:hypothetical protein
LTVAAFFHSMGERCTPPPARTSEEVARAAMEPTVEPAVVASPDVRGFFRESVERAMHALRLRAAEHTVHYVVNLLALYARAERLYERTAAGLDIKPLAFMVNDALEAPSLARRQAALRRLGDVALFIGGFFANSFSRKLVDVDYYIAMGSTAYATLSDSLLAERQGAVYAELSGKFGGFVDVLAEVSSAARPGSDTDVLRLYEIWLRTGSDRARRRLMGLGVLPAPNTTTRQ